MLTEYVLLPKQQIHFKNQFFHTFLALTKKTDVSRLRLITNENVNAGYRIEVTEDGVTWKTVVDKTTGGLKREWQDYEFEAKGIQRLRIVPVGYGSIEIQE
ncbi:MAG: hypothetical protein HYY56_05500, partial [Candidatus Omnitrophica bacterium]|nr:hypothetical protein [Candidatus Omnitrophota bacterium]